MAKFADNLKLLRKKKGYTQTDLAELLGVSRSAIGMYESGGREPSFELLEAIADVFNVNMSILLGEEPANTSFDIFSLPGITPIERVRVPLLGSIACGEPKYADEDFERYVDSGAEIHADFALKAKGDSMVGARIYDGDIVFVRKQSIVENGEIAVVIIGDDATLKRFRRVGDMVILSPENPAYEDILVDLKRESVRILGKAIAFQSDVR